MLEPISIGGRASNRQRRANVFGIARTLDHFSRARPARACVRSFHMRPRDPVVYAGRRHTRTRAGPLGVDLRNPDPVWRIRSVESPAPSMRFAHPLLIFSLAAIRLAILLDRPPAARTRITCGWFRSITKWAAGVQRPAAGWGEYIDMARRHRALPVSRAGACSISAATCHGRRLMRRLAAASLDRCCARTRPPPRRTM